MLCAHFLRCLLLALLPCILPFNASLNAIGSNHVIKCDGMLEAVNKIIIGLRSQSVLLQIRFSRTNLHRFSSQDRRQHYIKLSKLAQQQILQRLYSRWLWMKPSNLWSHQSTQNVLQYPNVFNIGPLSNENLPKLLRNWLLVSGTVPQSAMLLVSITHWIRRCNLA